MIISIKNVNHSFKSADGTAKQVLHDVNMEEDIKTLALIGPSGGGKSTLLRILSNLITPTSGSVNLGTDQTGFVFQQNGLFRHWTGLQNITIPLEKVHGFTPEDAQKRAEELLDRFGLLDEAGKRPAFLSGGQNQRIAIARAVAPRPEMLFFDEPTSALDPEYTVEVLDMINELKDEGLNFIIVTHEIGFARRACEKMAFLAPRKGSNEGATLLETGKSNELFTHPKTEELKAFLYKILEW